MVTVLLGTDASPPVLGLGAPSASGVPPPAPGPGGGPGPAPPPPSPPSDVEGANGTPALLGGPTGPAVDLATGFLGVDVRAQDALGSSQIAELKATDVRTLRWPGGGLGDRFDPLADNDAGTVYGDDGDTSAVPTSYAQFASACDEIGCKAIVTLPAEIDNPSYAEKIVNYSLRTLDFTPEYWEIGNEPALWSHYGTPWDQWTASQNRAPTPLQYASLVTAYAKAIRRSEPGALVIAPGGIGIGGNQSWMKNVVSADGATISAAAIHVYPAGNIASGQSLAAWFASLNGSAALPNRVPNVVNTIQKACPNCSIPLLVDEYGTGTLAPSNFSIWNGYLAAYLGAEIVQALSLPIASLDAYAFSGGYAGSWFNGSGTAAASYLLYKALPTYLGNWARPISVNTTKPGLEAATGGSTKVGQQNLILVNTNSSHGFSVDLAAAFPSASGGVAWVFYGDYSTPSVVYLNANLASHFVLPKMSIAILGSLGSYSLGVS
jgi:hypothetical protein